MGLAWRLHWLHDPRIPRDGWIGLHGTGHGRLSRLGYCFLAMDSHMQNELEVLDVESSLFDRGRTGNRRCVTYDILSVLTDQWDICGT